MFQVIIRDKQQKGLRQITSLEELAAVKKTDILWVDLISFNKTEEKFFTELFGLQLQYSEAKSEEIETSSRFYEVNDVIYANSNFLQASKTEFNKEPITFIFYKDTLITVHDNEVKILNDIAKKALLLSQKHATKTGWHIFLQILEARIDADADIIEFISRQITALSKHQSLEHQVNASELVTINRYQELTMDLRENITDKQRMVSAFLKSQDVPDDVREPMRVVLNDINSLLYHTQFSFERLEYLQNTVLGLINIDQNKIIKLFTIASVIFLPPTLIASAYGMNFKYMPELDWMMGYPMAILLMVLSSVATLAYFKWRKWL